nr:hypothetical protein [Pseudomonas sp.]
MSEHMDAQTDVVDLYNIRHGRVERNEWQRFTPDATQSLPQAGSWLVPLSYWLEHADSLRSPGVRIGLLLTPDDEVERLQGRFEGVSIIAV